VKEGEKVRQPVISTGAQSQKDKRSGEIYSWVEMWRKR